MLISCFLCAAAHPGSTSFCRFNLTPERKSTAQNRCKTQVVFLLGSASDLVRCLVGFQSFTDPAPLARLEVFAYSTFKSCRAQNQSKTRVAITLRFASDLLRRVEGFQPLRVLLRMHDFQVVSNIQLCICNRTYVRIYNTTPFFTCQQLFYFFLQLILLDWGEKLTVGVC